MRVLSAGLFALVVSASACAAISGLNRYERGEADASTSSSVPGDEAIDSVSDPDAGEIGVAPASDGDGWGGAVNEQIGPTRDGGDAAVDSEAAVRELDSGSIEDAGEASDSAMIPDGYACGTASCGGCCDTSGNCVGGQSVATCGVGGMHCADCTAMGACSSAGSCAVPPKDAGPPPMCQVASCTNHCAGWPIQLSCCKLDQTCGCQWTIFAPCL